MAENNGLNERIPRVRLDGCLLAGRKILRDARLFLENSTVCQIVDAKMVHRRGGLVPFGVGLLGGESWLTKGASRQWDAFLKKPN